MKPLDNPKHERVAQLFFGDPERIGFRAYMAVYPKSSQHAAETAFSRLLKTAGFKARIAALTAAAAEKSGVTIERVMAEIAKLGFANMDDYIVRGENGATYVDLSKITRDQAAAIQSLNVETTNVITGEDDDEDEAESAPLMVRKVKFKLADKKGSLEILRKHLTVERNQKPGNDDAKPDAKDPSEVTALDKARRVAFLLETARIAATTLAGKPVKNDPPAPPAAPVKAPEKAKPKKEKSK